MSSFRLSFCYVGLSCRGYRPLPPGEPPGQDSSRGSGTGEEVPDSASGGDLARRVTVGAAQKNPGMISSAVSAKTCS